MRSRLTGRRLYIADLGRRLDALENGRRAMNPLGYRVLAKQLRSALAGEVALQLRQGFPELPQALLPVLAEVLEARHFDEHGQLFGPLATEVQARTGALLDRLSIR